MKRENLRGDIKTILSLRFQRLSTGIQRGKGDKILRQTKKDREFRFNRIDDSIVGFILRQIYQKPLDDTDWFQW